MYAEFEARDTVVVALSQEDVDMAKASEMGTRFDPKPRFDLVHDLERKETLAYDRTTAYLIDKKGVVRQIFPMIIHARPSWQVVLKEVDAMIAKDKVVEAGAGK